MKVTRIAGVSALALALLISGCSSGGSDKPETSSSQESGTVTIENCGQQVKYKTPITKLMANDGNIISIALAAGAKEQLTAVASLKRDIDVLSLKYGDYIRELNSVSDDYMNLENIIAADPQLVFAGWDYGFSEDKGVTPQVLKEHGIDSYILTESCSKADSSLKALEPWDALDIDIRNIGKLTGNEEEANKTADEIADRVKELRALPKSDKEPTAFLFDSASDTVFSSGSYGAPQAMMDSVGVKNALEDVNDNWTKVSWERLAAADPDIIFFVDYPPQTLDEKIAALESNPASKNLTAVREKRYVNLPYAMWTSGPLNVEGAEYMRMALEHWELAPKTDITSKLDIRKLDSLPGNEWLK